ncbi:hypothetical protein EDB81DRAFT_174821 [Dactylonectria macrodidyma]|uniref:Uncharacterized protein n=1 Tax=Dactylonectria macrodidyma TaxID=307937 RepID=A0A9P9JPE2_9HYPO|nr:hypothetical protein EDB81DRAFT_174821 [Dactylonectria macrodidyma]
MSFSPRHSIDEVRRTKSGNRHQLKRSITELTSPTKLSRQQRKDRDRSDDRPPQATSANPFIWSRTSVDMPRSEGVTPVISPDQSRRPSVMLQREEENRAQNPAPPSEPKANKEEKLREEREKTSSQVEGLKKSLVDLSTFSTSASRRLDDTYYAVLEKMSTLQHTVAALKDLAETSRNIHNDFDKDSKELEDDITFQIASMGQFEEQEASIQSLQTRIQDGRAKIRSLSDRVEVVRRRVEGWEGLDKVSQEKTRRRFRVIWICMAVVTLAMVVVYFFGAQYAPPSSAFMHTETRMAESIIESRKEAGHTDVPAEMHEDDDGTYLRKRTADGGERLRVFDEL